MSQSNTPPVRLSAAHRTQSTPVLSKASPSHRPRQQKHVVGHSGLNAHSRNRSHGKLTTLGKATTKTQGEDTSTANHMKRNSSNLSLSRTGSKVSIKRNSSNVSLKRNGSSAQVNKTSRPTTPVRRSKSRDEEEHGSAGSKVTFQMDDENNDDEWTEESNSQSPSVTRQSSISRGGGRSGRNTPAQQRSGISTPAEQNTQGTQPPVSQPQYRTSAYDGTNDSQDSNAYDTTGGIDPQISHSPTSQRKSRVPDADAITSRLLNRGSSFRLDPKVTSVSATGTPGTHTPPLPQSQESTSLADPSLPPPNGISRFLNASSASASSTWAPTPALAAHLSTPPTLSHQNRIHTSRTRSPSPTRPTSNDSTTKSAMRQSKSAANLTSSSSTATPNSQHATPLHHPHISQDSTSARAVTFEQAPAQRRQAGRNTDAKLAMWKAQTSVEPAHGPPAPMLRGPNAVAVGQMGVEEKRARLNEEAERELGFLRRFRNPVVDAARRAVNKDRAKKGGKDKSTAGTDGGAVNRNSREMGRAGGMVNGVGTVKADRKNEVNGTSRPQSRAGPRNVRFEVGLDPGDEGPEEEPHDGGVEALLRSLWVGGEMENVHD